MLEAGWCLTMVSSPFSYVRTYSAHPLLHFLFILVHYYPFAIRLFLQTTNDKLSQCIHYLDAYSSENNLKMPTFTAKSAKVYVRNKIKLFICLKKYSIAYLDTYEQYPLYNQFNNSYFKIIFICILFYILISMNDKLQGFISHT